MYQAESHEHICNFQALTPMLQYSQLF